MLCALFCTVLAMGVKKKSLNTHSVWQPLEWERAREKHSTCIGMNDKCPWHCHNDICMYEIWRESRVRSFSVTIFQTMFGYLARLQSLELSLIFLHFLLRILCFVQLSHFFMFLLQLFGIQVLMFEHATVFDTGLLHSTELSSLCILRTKNMADSSGKHCICVPRRQ